MTKFERRHGRWAALWARYSIYATIIAFFADLIAKGHP